MIDVLILTLFLSFVSGIYEFGGKAMAPIFDRGDKDEDRLDRGYSNRPATSWM